MKTLSFILFISIFFTPTLGFGQSDLDVEKDDLYFTSKDRKVLNEKIALQEKREAEALKKSGYAYDQFESSNNSFEETQNKESKINEELNQAPPQAEQNSDEAWYYDESAARNGRNPQNGQRLAQTQVYNYYGGMNPWMYGWNDPWMYGFNDPWAFRGFYDPFMYRPGFNVGFGFNSWAGMNSLSIGFGGGFYDPFFNPYWGSPFAARNIWGNPYWGRNSLWAYHNGYRNGFYDGYYSGLHNGGFYNDHNLNRRNRTYTSNPRISRSSDRTRVVSSRTRNSNDSYAVSRNVGTDRSRSVAQATDRSRNTNAAVRRTDGRTSARASGTNNSTYSRTSRTAQYARATSDNNVRSASYDRSRSSASDRSNAGRYDNAGSSSSRFYNSSRTNRSTYSSGRSSNNNSGRSADFGRSSSRSNNSYGRSSGSSRSNSSFGNSSRSNRSIKSSSSRSRGSSSSYSRPSSSSSSSSRSSSSGRSSGSSSSRSGRGG